MMNDNAKIFIAAAAATLWAYAQQIVIPLTILLVVMVVDYVTGVTAAWKKGELSSRVGIVGILKKLSYLALVVVGCVMDYLVSMVGGQIAGTEIAFQAIGLVVICWLIINELISILENVSRIGGPVPPFLAPLLKRLKNGAEAQIPQLQEQQSEPEGKHVRK